MVCFCVWWKRSHFSFPLWSLNGPVFFFMRGRYCNFAKLGENKKKLCEELSAIPNVCLFSSPTHKRFYSLTGTAILLFTRYFGVEKKNVYNIVNFFPFKKFHVLATLLFFWITIFYRRTLCLAIYKLLLVSPFI